MGVDCAFRWRPERAQSLAGRSARSLAPGCGREAQEPNLEPGRRTICRARARTRPIDDQVIAESAIEWEAKLIPFVREHRKRVEFDAFLAQVLRLLRRSLAVDRAMVDLAVVHLARFLGKLLPDVIGVLGQVIAQLPELRSEFALLRRHHRDRRLGGIGRGCPGHRRLGRRRLGCGRLGRWRWRRASAAFLGAGKRRRHDRLLDLAVAAGGAGHQPALGLLVVGRRIGKPALEGMALRANERVTDHRSAPTALNGTGSASGSTISNRRPCCSEGMRPRAAATSAGATLPVTSPGPGPPSAPPRPHGATISEWPKVARPFSCMPPWAAANTKQPFSIARARISTCQCASPVCLVKAAGTEMNEEPASASAR